MQGNFCFILDRINKRLNLGDKMLKFEVIDRNWK